MILGSGAGGPTGRGAGTAAAGGFWCAFPLAADCAEQIPQAVVKERAAHTMARADCNILPRVQHGTVYTHN